MQIYILLPKPPNLWTKKPYASSYKEAQIWMCAVSSKIKDITFIDTGSIVIANEPQQEYGFPF